MLTLHAFLIFVLGSSVIAMPTPQQPYHEARLLKGNTDKRLVEGLWGQAVTRTVSEGETRYVPTWADAQHCDDFIKFSNGGSGHVEDMSIRRVVREAKALEESGPKRTFEYAVNRHSYGENPTQEIYRKVPLNKWADYLDHTYWGRVPTIVGEVSDGLMI